MNRRERRKLNQLMDRAHARYGPSGFSRLINCAVSFWLTKDLKDEKKSWSEKGTLAHELCELFVEDRLKDPFEGYRAVDNDKYDAEMRRHARYYAEYVFDMVEEHLEKDCIWFIEKRLLGDLDNDVWGTADFLFLYKDYIDKDTFVYRFIIIDFKYGEGVAVNTKGNWQLLGYAYCAVREFGPKLDGPIESIETHIVQPRMEHETPPQTYKVSVLERKYFPVIEKAVQVSEGFFDREEITEEEYQQYQKPGDHCRFCLANKKGICNILNKEKADKVINAFSKAVEKIPIKELKNTEHYENTGVLDKETLEYIALHKAELSKMIDGIHEAVQHLAEAGEKFDSVKLVEKSVPRSLIEDEEKIAKHLQRWGVFEPFKTVKKLAMTMTEMERTFGKDKVAPLIKKPDPGAPKQYKLVPRDHSAPEVEAKSDVVSIFKQAINNRKEN